jgi:hypothetical protein
MPDASGPQAGTDPATPPEPLAPAEDVAPTGLPTGVADGDGAIDEFGEKLAAFNAFRKNDEAAADAILTAIGARGPAEVEIIRQMAVPRPLYRDAGSVEQAHRQVMRSLEVLMRNGARNVKLPRLGPLTPLAGFLVVLLTRFIVRSHTRTLLNALDDLYTRREAWCRPGTPERRTLQRARMDVGRVRQTLRGKVLGLPSFLVGGAFVSTLLSVARSGADTVTRNRGLIAVATLLLLLLFLGAAWAALRGAAAARRRIKLTTDQPMKTLYALVGAAGNPPKDQSVVFALVAIVAMAVAWLVIPAGLVLVFLT